MGYKDWSEKMFVWKEMDEEDNEYFSLAIDKSDLPDENGQEIAIYKLVDVYQLSVKKDLVKE